MKFYWRDDVYIPELILNFSIGWNLALSFTHRSPYLRETPFGHLIIMRLCGLENQSGRFREEKICYPCRGSNCNSSLAQSVA